MDVWDGAIVWGHGGGNRSGTSRVFWFPEKRAVLAAVVNTCDADEVFMTGIFGELCAALQTVVPASMRAVAVALLYLFANLIGMGLGPLLAGALSDLYRPWWGEESLRYALLCLCPGYFWAAWHLWLASRSVVSDLRAVEVWDATDALAAGNP